MIKRCIMIFPEFGNEKIINEIREKYDPLANHIKPHITLVFPFDSEIETKELQDHIMSAISGIKPFEIVLGKFKPVNAIGKYLFLNIKEGSESIKELHKRLYTEILKPYFPKWLKDGTFLPHMTVGCFDNDEKFTEAVYETQNIKETFKTVVTKVSVEIIDENEDSIIELVIPFK